MPRKRKLSIFFWLISVFVILGIAGVLSCNLWVIKSGEGRVYRQVSGVLGAEEAPGEKWPVGMVLGTSKKVDVNTPNSNACVSCAAGTFSDASGAGICKACPQGSY